MPTVRFPLICVATALLAGFLPHAATADTLLGHWVLNRELSRELPPVNSNQKKNSFQGFSNIPSVVVPNLPTPIPGSSSTNVSGALIKDPRVLRCIEMTIELVGEDILFTYTGFGTEQLKQGSVRGTKTTYKSRKLTSRYETTSRKVTKTFELTKEGRLHVTVKLKPNKGKALVQHRIFERSSLDR